MYNTYSPPYEPSLSLACSTDRISHSPGRGASCGSPMDDAIEPNEGKFRGSSVTMKIVPLHIITLSMMENPTREWSRHISNTLRAVAAHPPATCFNNCV